MYCGRPLNITSYLENLGYKCPLFRSPDSFMIFLCCQLSCKEFEDKNLFMAESGFSENCNHEVMDARLVLEASSQRASDILCVDSFGVGVNNNVEGQVTDHRYIRIEAATRGETLVVQFKDDTFKLIKQIFWLIKVLFIHQFHFIVILFFICSFLISVIFSFLRDDRESSTFVSMTKRK